MQQFSSIFLFYRPFFLWSYGVNFLLLLLGFDVIPLFLVKVFLVVFLWYFITETQAKHKLIFYKNLGVSTLKLFALFFLIDVILSLPFILIIKEFV